MLNYDRSLSLGFEEYSSIKKDGYAVKDVSYISPYGGKVPAYLVVPDTDGPLPAVVFMHPGQGSRSTFLLEAESLASKGIVSLLIAAPAMRSQPPKDLSEEEQFNLMIKTITAVSQYAQTVVDIQRGIDLLCSFENIDSNRLAYIGHSLGATWGGVLAGVEKRIQSYVLMAGFSSVSEWHKTSEHPLAALIRTALPKQPFQKFISELEPLDAVHYINKAAPASLFFQFAYDDEFVPKHQADTFYSAASLPKKISWYKTDHLFTNCRLAYQERTQWMIKQLRRND
ncbi:alpha/beta hydrolase [Bacillus badius]|uniref:alpha/beta hydrolase family protein n=1 Tax=Bacillus badius TaxID=1455 RepID=UPI001CBAF002|nr:alpha/beta hydrolase [Bacillus badius]UAT29066.1 alpha/beta hydrolase [Bacillus badius]